MYLADIAGSTKFLCALIFSLSVVAVGWICVLIFQKVSEDGFTDCKSLILRSLYIALSVVGVSFIILMFTPSKTTMLTYAGLLAREHALHVPADAPVAENLLIIIENELGVKLSESSDK